MGVAADEGQAAGLAIRSYVRLLRTDLQRIGHIEGSLLGLVFARTLKIVLEYASSIPCVLRLAEGSADLQHKAFPVNWSPLPFL